VPFPMPFQCHDMSHPGLNSAHRSKCSPFAGRDLIVPLREQILDSFQVHFSEVKIADEASGFTQEEVSNAYVSMSDSAFMKRTKTWKCVSMEHKINLLVVPLLICLAAHIS
jgi:hypothetical protein